MKRIFAIPVLIFASFVLLLYVVLPKIETSSREKEKFLKAQESVKNRRQYFANLKATLLETESYKEAINNIETSISGEVSLADLIGFFSEKSSNNGLILKSVAPVQTTAPDNALTTANKASFQPFSVALTGGVNSLESFLKDIEASVRLVDVESVSLQSKDDKNRDLMEANVQVKVYY